MTTETRITKSEAVGGWLAENRAAIRLPANIDIERLRWETAMAIRRNPDLAQCSTTSLLNATLQIASYGLYPGPLAHLVPFKTEVVPIIDYKGMLELLALNGVRKVEARVVRGGDLFEVQYGTNPSIAHQERGPSTRGWTHVYAVVWLPSGETQFEVMDKAAVMAIRARSPSIRGGGSSPWKTDEEAMALKTVLRRIAKYIPKKTRELNLALGFEDEADTTGYVPRMEQDVAAIAPPREDTQDAPPQEVTPGAADGQPRDLFPGSGEAPTGVEPEPPQTSDPLGEESGDTPPGVLTAKRLITTCPKHGVPWDPTGKFGPDHREGNGFCNLGAMLQEMKEEARQKLVLGLKETTEKIAAMNGGTAWTRLNIEQKAATVIALREEAGLQ